METFDTTVETHAESLFAPLQTPRLSILHLMLWTLCSALCLALMRAIYALQEAGPASFVAIQDASSVMQGMITGAVLAGALVLVRTRFRSGPPMLRQPGHWLLFVSAIFQLTYLPSIALLMLLQDSAAGGRSFFMYLGMLYLLPALAYGFAARHNTAFRWRVIFVGAAIVALSQCISYAVLGLSNGGFGSWFRIVSVILSFGSVLLPIVVLVVSIVDLAAARRYDWLHWTGVATHVAGVSVTVLWMIAARFVS